MIVVREDVLFFLFPFSVMPVKSKKKVEGRIEIGTRIDDRNRAVELKAEAVAIMYNMDVVGNSHVTRILKMLHRFIEQVTPKALFVGSLLFCVFSLRFEEG